MINLFRSRNFYVVFFVDLFLVFLSWCLAFGVRFDLVIPEHYLSVMWRLLPLVIIIKMSIFFYCNLYQGMWRFTSLFDLVNVVKAVITSSILLILFVVVLHRFEGYPRSVFIIDFGLCLIFIGGLRASIRMYYTRNSGMTYFPTLSRAGSTSKRLLIIGAGSTGEKVLREIRDNPNLKLHPVGFLDDNIQKQSKTIHGIAVLGRVEEISSFIDLFDEILIAIPKTSRNNMRRIVASCESTGRRFRTVPAIGELIDGRVSVKALRDVTLQDLMGREEIRLNKAEISRYIHEKRVLITGAGGSIGSELVRQVSRFHPRKLGLLEISELNLFRVEMECHQRFGYMNVESYLADIRDSDSISRVFNDFQPEVVFHTAAYKHVPMQERHPWEAIFNNIQGTLNLVNIAKENNIERFVLVSTDKAVRPTNVMGASKRIAEQLVLCANDNENSQFMAVRFGNVMGSSGSVIPIFQDQIARGGPVTVTHPEVTRYFMSIPEAAQLILEAGAMGEGGEIFILDMGRPVRILDIAQDLIRLHGYEPHRDIEIQYSGLRPGEKLYEELITEGEGIVETQHEKILVLRGDLCNMNQIHSKIKNLVNIAKSYDHQKIKQVLKEMVPEYQPEW
ncbi:nucleoside-diphosphate sugar epimerase [Candidatus Magnetomorum sp. HK-1]|nr:nucleoside-diphosphate sugar epimerase [Candidatus Magnetomorum sp. HK-1]